MAAISLDADELSFFTTQQTSLFDVYPKSENQIGDTPYTPNKSFVLVLSKHDVSRERCVWHKALSFTLILILGVIVEVLGGDSMYYIPLYLALMPILYWVLKIGYAIFIVKSRKLHVDSTVFSWKSRG